MKPERSRGQRCRETLSFLVSALAADVAASYAQVVDTYLPGVMRFGELYDSPGCYGRLNSLVPVSCPISAKCSSQSSASDEC